MRSQSRRYWFSPSIEIRKKIHTRTAQNIWLNLLPLSSQRSRQTRVKRLMHGLSAFHLLQVHAMRTMLCVRPLLLHITTHNSLYTLLHQLQTVLEAFAQNKTNRSINLLTAPLTIQCIIIVPTNCDAKASINIDSDRLCKYKYVIRTTRSLKHTCSGRKHTTFRICHKLAERNLLKILMNWSSSTI